MEVPQLGQNFGSLVFTDHHTWGTKIHFVHHLPFTKLILFEAAISFLNRKIPSGEGPQVSILIGQGVD